MTPLHRPAMRLRFPVLVADVGGTNTRFALVSDVNAAAHSFEPVRTADFPDIVQAISTTVLDHTSLMPRTAVIAMAGPVTGDQIPLTNADWIIEPKGLIESLGFETVVVLNDFEAQALALPGLEGDDLKQIGGGAITPLGAKVVIGPGTGLGAATMVHAAETWIPIPGEGGHVELGPVGEDEYRIWAHIPPMKDGRISAEHIISGSGLPRLAHAVAAADNEIRNFGDAADVTNAADHGDPVAGHAMEVFCRALGRVAGDFAISCLARGGVYLAGGIPRKIERHLNSGAFRSSFEAKAPHAHLMQGVPTFLINHPNPALEGLAAFARTPSLFAVELDGRRWTREVASS